MFSPVCAKHTCQHLCLYLAEPGSHPLHLRPSPNREDHSSAPFLASLPPFHLRSRQVFEPSSSGLPGTEQPNLVTVCCG